MINYMDQSLKDFILEIKADIYQINGSLSDRSCQNRFILN